MFDEKSILSIVNDFEEKYNLKDLKNVSSDITDKYKNKSGKGVSLVNQEIDAYTYLKVRFPATYMAACRVLEMCKDIFNDDISTVLDVGAGMGTASLACLCYLGDNSQLTLIEREKEMIKLGNELFLRIDSKDKFKYFECDYTNYSFDEKYDLVIASYTLNELSKDKRKEIVEKLWHVTSKYLIIIEPGTKECYRQIMDEREYLMNNGAKIIAPCGTNIKCSIESDDWCHFTVRVPRSKIHKMIKVADAPYEDEKFSFIAVSKEKEYPLKKRVLRHPIIRTGYVSIKVCSEAGIEDVTISKKDGELYKIARKAKTGDTIAKLC